MDYSNPLGVEFREVRDTTVEGQPARVVAGTRTYTTVVQDLWEALTKSERIPRWFLPISGDLRLGGRYQLEGNAGGVITRCDAPNAFAVTWEFGGSTSWVTVRLATDGDRTRLTLEHSMPKDELGEAHWKQFGPGATGVGWDLTFFGLALHLENEGEAIDRQAGDAWMASKSGKTFMRACAEAWGDTHIAAGESADIARAMAKQTATAYTGN